jgi:hypothetical protein
MKSFRNIYNAPSYENNIVDPSLFSFGEDSKYFREKPNFLSVDVSATQAGVSRKSLYYHLRTSKKLRGYTNTENGRIKWYALHQDVLELYTETPPGVKQKQGTGSVKSIDNNRLIESLTHYFDEFGKLQWINSDINDVRKFIYNEIERLSV